MNRSQEFPRVSTIGSVYRPVERYLERLGEAGSGTRPIAPLDAYLLHLIFEFCPHPVPVVDLTFAPTSGTASVVGLASRNVSEVYTADETDSHPARQARQRRLLGDATGARSGALLPLERGESPWHAARSVVEADDLPLFLIDPSCEFIRLDRDLGAILEGFPRAILLVLPVGCIGECEAVRELAQACAEGSPCRLWLLREASGALISSRLAMVARRCNPLAPHIVSRIQTLLSTNYDYLNLLNESCTYAAERPDVLKLEAEVGRLTGEVARLTQQLPLPRVQGHREEKNSVVRAIVLGSGRKIIHLARRNRAWLVPQGGLRERFARKVLAGSRRLGGRAV